MATTFPTFKPFDVPEPLKAPHLYSYVHFRHPGLPQSAATLFSLLRVDATQAVDTEISAIEYGIHHGTALDACRIVANNAPGFLSTTSDPLGRLQSAPDDILLGEFYYYILDDETQRGDIYPVVTTFVDWDFPPEVPERWSIFTARDPNLSIYGTPASAMSTAVLARDDTCRVSKYGDSLENAHLVPKEEWIWYSRNNMHYHNLNLLLDPHNVTEDIRNGVLLRADIHTALDRKNFVFVPKFNQPVLHFRAPSRTLRAIYHNAVVQLPNDSLARFWYARFAHNMFPLNLFRSNMPNDAKIKVGTSIVLGSSLQPRKHRRSTSSAHSSSTPPPPSPKRTRMDDTIQSMPTAEGADTHSQIDEEAEYREDLEIQKKQFPSMSQEHCHSDDFVWNQIYWYPGHRRVVRMKKRYTQENPSVTTVAEPEKAMWVDSED